MEKTFDFDVFWKNHESQHKAKPSQFGSVVNGVRKRLETTIQCRKSSRLTNFDHIRNLPSCDSPKQIAPSKAEQRAMKLQKWKEEREKQKKAQSATKKKPFVIGIVHAPLKFEPPPPPPKAVPSTSGRVTRSQTAKSAIPNTKVKQTKAIPKPAKVSFAPENASFRPPPLKNGVKVPILAPTSKLFRHNEVIFEPVVHKTQKVKQKPALKDTQSDTTIKQVRNTRGRPAKPGQSSNKGTKSEETKESKAPKSIKTKRNERAPSTVQQTGTPKNVLPKSESGSEEKLKKTPEQIAEEARKNSPFVTRSRGKDNARREVKKKIDEGLFDEESTNLESVAFFRRQLDTEIKRMTEVADSWEKISQQIALPEAVQELVLGAVGQARLLMSHKLQQFASLVARCERPEPGRARVTPADLHGFWDMVFMQVENVDMRFKKLEEMRARNWAEEAPAPAPPRRAARPAPRAAPRPAATSRLKDMIAAARRAKLGERAPAADAEPAAPSPPAQPEGAERTFDAGFFCVRSPPRAPATPSRKDSLLKAVLSNETHKSAAKNSTSIAMLRASQISKNSENDSFSDEPQVPLTPINLNATPARSILKPNTAPSTAKTTRKSGKKSIKVVLFDDEDSDEPSAHGEYVNGVGNLIVDNLDCEQKENLMSPMTVQESEISEVKSPPRRVMTRRMRKSLPDIPIEVEVETPKRRSRRNKNVQENDLEQKMNPQRSSKRKSAVP